MLVASREAFLEPPLARSSASFGRCYAGHLWPARLWRGAKDSGPCLLPGVVVSPRGLRCWRRRRRRHAPRPVGLHDRRTPRHLFGGLFGGRCCSHCGRFQLLHSFKACLQLAYDLLKACLKLKAVTVSAAFSSARPPLPPLVVRQPRCRFSGARLQDSAQETSLSKAERKTLMTCYCLSWLKTCVLCI